jgi:cytidyltransferase-like protein
MIKPANHPVALVDGCFDPLHAGHIHYFRRAQEFGFPLVCKAAGDEYISKKHPLFLAQERRYALLEALGIFENIYLSSQTTAEVLALLKPKLYIKGSEWRGKLPAA